MPPDPAPAMDRESVAKAIYDAYAKAEQAQGFPHHSRWPIRATDHAERWYAAADAVLALVEAKVREARKPAKGRRAK